MNIHNSKKKKMKPTQIYKNQTNLKKETQNYNKTHRSKKQHSDLKVDLKPTCKT